MLSLERVLHGVDNLREVEIINYDLTHKLMISLQVLNLLVQVHQVEKDLSIYEVRVNILSELSHVFRVPMKYSINVKMTNSRIRLFFMLAVLVAFFSRWLLNSALLRLILPRRRYHMRSII